MLRPTFIGKSKGKNHLEDLGVDGRVILELKLIFFSGVSWIHLVMDRD
jgi:hypothetical protein